MFGKNRFLLPLLLFICIVPVITADQYTNLYNRTIVNGNTLIPEKVYPLPDNSALILGIIKGHYYPDPQPFLLKVDETGTPLWRWIPRDSGVSNIMDLEIRPDNTIVLYGTYKNAKGDCPYIVELAHSGRVIREHFINDLPPIPGSEGRTRVLNMKTHASDGTIYFAGYVTETKNVGYYNNEDTESAPLLIALDWRYRLEWQKIVELPTENRGDSSSNDTPDARFTQLKPLESGLLIATSTIYYKEKQNKTIITAFRGEEKKWQLVIEKAGSEYLRPPIDNGDGTLLMSLSFIDMESWIEHFIVYVINLDEGNIISQEEVSKLSQNVNGKYELTKIRRHYTVGNSVYIPSGDREIEIKQMEGMFNLVDTAVSGNNDIFILYKPEFPINSVGIARYSPGGEGEKITDTEKETGQEEDISITMEPAGYLYHWDINNDASKMLVAKNKTIYIRDLAKQVLEKTIPVENFGGYSAAYLELAEDQNKIIYIDSEKVLYLFDYLTGNLLYSKVLSSDRVISYKYSNGTLAFITEYGLYQQFNLVSSTFTTQINVLPDRKPETYVKYAAMNDDLSLAALISEEITYAPLTREQQYRMEEYGESPPFNITAVRELKLLDTAAGEVRLNRMLTDSPKDMKFGNNKELFILYDGGTFQHIIRDNELRTNLVEDIPLPVDIPSSRDIRSFTPVNNNTGIVFQSNYYLYHMNLATMEVRSYPKFSTSIQAVKDIPGSDEAAVLLGKSSLSVINTVGPVEAVEKPFPVHSMNKPVIITFDKSEQYLITTHGSDSVDYRTSYLKQWDLKRGILKGTLGKEVKKIDYSVIDPFQGEFHHSQNYDQNIIYSLSSGLKKNTLRLLKYLVDDNDVYRRYDSAKLYPLFSSNQVVVSYSSRNQVSLHSYPSMEFNATIHYKGGANPMGIFDQGKKILFGDSDGVSLYDVEKDAILWNASKMEIFSGVQNYFSSYIIDHTLVNGYTGAVVKNLETGEPLLSIAVNGKATSPIPGKNSILIYNAHGMYEWDLDAAWEKRHDFVFLEEMARPKYTGLRNVQKIYHFVTVPLIAIYGVNSAGTKGLYFYNSESDEFYGVLLIAEDAYWFYNAQGKLYSSSSSLRSSRKSFIPLFE